MKPAVGGRAVRQAGTALDREQPDPAPVIRLAEGYDALDKAAGVPESLPVEQRVVHEDTPGLVPGHADVHFETLRVAGDLLHNAAHPAGLVGQRNLPCVTRVDAGCLIAAVSQLYAICRGMDERGVDDPVMGLRRPICRLGSVCDVDYGEVECGGEGGECLLNGVGILDPAEMPGVLYRRGTHVCGGVGSVFP